MKHFIVLLLIALTVTFDPPSSLRAQTNKNWESLVGDFVETYLRLNPEVASNLGRHDFDGLIADFSPEGLKAQIDWIKSENRLIQDFKDSDLNREELIQKKYLLMLTESNIFFLEEMHRPYRNANFFFLNPSIYLTSTGYTPEERIKTFTKFLTSMAVFIEQIENGYKSELPLPKVYFEIAKATFGGYADFIKTDATDAFRDIKNESLFNKFNNAKTQALEKLNAFYSWLDEKEAKGTEDFALGKEKFNKMLWVTEGISTPVAELKQMAEKDLERNTQALKKACQLFAPGEPVEEAIRRANAEIPEKGILETAKEQLVMLENFIREKHIVTIPEYASIVVKESPSYMKSSIALERDAGPFAKKSEGIYYITLPDPEWDKQTREDFIPSKSNLLFLSAHEIWPGHFLNFLHNRHIKFLPAAMFFDYLTGEGWAHYTEEMMFSQGLGDNSPESEIGLRLNQLKRNVRFLAAIMLHTEGASVNEIEELFKKYAFLDDINAKKEALRGTYDPQYFAYNLGKLLITDLRDKWMQRQGKKASLQDFHDKFLSYGSIPVPLISEDMLAEEGNLVKEK